MKDLCILHNHVVSMLFMMELIEFWKQKWKYNFCIKNIQMEGTNKRHIQLVYKASKPSTHSISLNRIADLNLIFWNSHFLKSYCLIPFVLHYRLRKICKSSDIWLGFRSTFKICLKLSIYTMTLYLLSLWYLI